MQSKTKNHLLHPPKITPITKQQFRRFHVVRQLKTPCLGVHTLLAHSQNKYISVNLPISTKFLTTRPNIHHIYHYTQQSNNTYIFQLVGQSLCDIWRGHVGAQIKQWIDKAGGIGNAMMELLICCLKMYTQDGVQDVMAQWWRIGGGKLMCCWDTWMKSSCEIASQDPMEIQNYFLSQSQLTYIQFPDKNRTPPAISPKQYLFKLGFFIISLCMPEVKIRNYQYCQYKLSNQNIQQRFNLFKIKVANRQLLNLVNKFIHGQLENMEQVWRILDVCKTRGESPSINSNSNGTLNRKSLTKVKQNNDKQNLLISEAASIATATKHSRKMSNNSKVDSFVNLNTSNYKKIKLKSRYNNTFNQSSNKICLPQQEIDKQKKAFSLKQLMSKQFSNNCQKLIQYLGLSQHIHQSAYQLNVIKSLQEIRIKSDWQYKIYANGSIYMGQLVDDKRDGKGVYLFDSQDLYVGDWKDNFMNGVGCYVFRSGQLYEGELRKGSKCGFGKFRYQDGKIYEGHWLDNFKYGFGTVIFPNSTKFIGFFNKTNQTYGLFTMIKQYQLIEFQGNLEAYNWQTNTFSSTQLCIQSLKSKLKKCKTQSYIPCLKNQGSKYYGQCLQSNPNGYGIRQGQTQIYEGYWRNGKQDGQGKLTVKNKFEIEGFWADGIMVEYKLK